MKAHTLGKIGERLAVAHLRAAGCQILDRNWHCRRGEIDIVAKDEAGWYAFVEVKARRGVAFGAPEEAITPQKADRLRATAQAWLAAHLGDTPVDWRIDLVAVEFMPDGSLLRVDHLPYAI